MKELLKSKNRHILSDQKVTRISIDACSTTYLYGMSSCSVIHVSRSNMNYLFVL